MAPWKPASFGLEEIVDRSDAIVVIEWAERVTPPALPADYLQITFTDDQSTPDQRQIHFLAHGAQSAALIDQLSAHER